MNALGLRITLAAGLACIPLLGAAHHSFAPVYEIDGDTEIAGEVVELRWKNPHIEFDVLVRDDSGDETLYTVESESLPGLRGMNIQDPFVAVGDQVRLAGNPGRRAPRVFLKNILLASGSELILREDIEPRFSAQVIDTRGARDATEGDSSAPGLGIFRVWTTPRISPFPFPEDVTPALAHSNFPLTATARAVLESFVDATDNPIRNCMTKGMPTIMEQPYPMRMYPDADGNIVMHMEEYDLRRTFYMDQTTAPEPVPNILGYSLGRWNGHTLIVTTTHLNWGWYNTVGIPLSEAATTVEEFTLQPDGSRLDWKMTVTDPATFTEPVEVEKFFLYVPGVRVQDFDCTPGN